MELSMLYVCSMIAYAVLAVVTLFLRIPAVTSRNMKEKVEFREVLQIARKDPALFVGLINNGLITLFLGGINLLILNLSELQQEPQLMGWIYTVEGTSILIGGLLAKRWIGGKNLVAASTLMLFFFALSQFGMSFAAQKAMVLSSFSVLGFVVAFFFPVLSTIFQKRLPAHQQGRFFSFKSMLDRGCFLLALGITGIGLDLLGISGYLLFIGSITLLSGILTFVYSKKHRLDVRESDEAAA
ncbi:MFS transporter [Brevibacillus gelatini]